MDPGSSHPLNYSPIVGERLRYARPWPGYTPRQMAIWLMLHCDEGEALDYLRLAGELWRWNTKVRACALCYLKPHNPRAAA
jgi:hypothetical protein